MAKLNPPTKPSTTEAPSKIEAVIQKAKPDQPIEQTPPDEIAPLQLKIPKSKKNEFKAYAAMRGRSMNTLFLDMFDEYKTKHA